MNAPPSGPARDPSRGLSARGEVPSQRAVEALQQQLVDWFGRVDSCAVALSAGVDSSVVAMAAHRALGDRALAITADSPSLARDELAQARAVARRIGIRHHVLATGELDQVAYRRNAPDRCFHCKTELYAQMARVAPELGVRMLLNGANADDLGDYRPGLEAAGAFQVRSPLIECGLGKADVRRLAGHWGLPNWDKPAAPCLSSRLAYGVEVTAERLQRVEAGEAYLRSLGFHEFRLRYHPGDVARIEVPADQIVRLCQAELRGPLVERLKSLGFRFVTLDLVGFQSGSLNQLIPPEALAGAAPRAKG